MFSLKDKYGKLREPHPKFSFFFIGLLAVIACYQTIELANSKREILKTKIEKEATNLLYTDIKEENLEYYLLPPYCGYAVESKSINLQNINRKALDANIIQKEYINKKEVIKVSICFTDTKIKGDSQKYLLMIIILFICITVLTRRQHAHEKAKFFRSQALSIPQGGRYS
jgi:hypothetical protein